MDFILRPECSSDHRDTEELTRKAFWNLYKPGCDEHYLAHIVRNHPDFLREWSFVALMEGKIVGSIFTTKSRIRNTEGKTLETISFGPICVEPSLQRRGIGTALLERLIELARNAGYPALITYGDPHNYCKHGFRNGKDHGISDREGKYPLGLLVLELEKGFGGGQHWTFHESSAYEFDPDEAEVFDRTFPPWEKHHHHSQELFHILVRSYLIDD
ncbi:MAG: N-acetyltransferase [Fibrobacteria bacterium]|nr:N-acetyltransferase [Fibrobacteria bacterium]